MGDALTRLADTETTAKKQYGRRNVAKMIREWDTLRHAIRAEGTPLIQDALDQVEGHIDYAYRHEPFTHDLEPI